MPVRDFDADRLYEIVATYADFGDHLTGTAADDDTTAWLRRELKEMGAEVEDEPFGFERFVCDATLRAGDEIVPTLPLFYSAIGDLETDQLDVVELDASVVGKAAGMQELLPDPDSTRGLIVAFTTPENLPEDLPVQCNRVPTELSGQPAVVIAGNWVDRVKAGATLTFSAALELATSANVLARFGDPAAPAVNITTPLTGWTPAAGERGTGMAVALAMAADDYRVNFSACSGHELNHIGLHHHLASRDVTGTPTVHLGASVAAIEPGATGYASLGDRRMCLTTAVGDTRAEIERRVPAANWRLVDLDPWAGEGGTWREAGASVLSFLGGSRVFHTAADTISATDPQALERAAQVAIDCARVFLEIGDST